MSLIRSKNTKPEKALRKLLSSALYPLGYRYRLHYKRLSGKPDIVFVRHKIAVFVDGAFWHGYDFENLSERLETKYWLPKITQNIERDKKVNQAIRREGWHVLRVWDHEIYKNPDKVIQRVHKMLLKSETKH